MYVSVLLKSLLVGLNLLQSKLSGATAPSMIANLKQERRVQNLFSKDDDSTKATDEFGLVTKDNYFRD